MDLTEISHRSGLPVRKLQYTCDHDLLPGAAQKGLGFGVRRDFLDVEAFGILLAATMLGAGLSRRLVKACMTALCREARPKRARIDAPLVRAFASRSGTLEIGDGRFWRCRTRRTPGVVSAFEADWRGLAADVRPLAGYEPVLTVTVELGRLAALIGPNA